MLAIAVSKADGPAVEDDATAFPDCPAPCCSHGFGRGGKEDIECSCSDGESKKTQG